jgi:hypothetical protein
VGGETYPAEVQDLVAALFQLEKARDEPTWLAVYARLVALLDTGALDSLKRAFGRWIYRSFIRKKRPGIRLPDIPTGGVGHCGRPLCRNRRKPVCGLPANP